MDLIYQNVNVLLLGILMNLLLTFAFGIYKVFNLSYAQTVLLMEKYPVKTKYAKLFALWLVPWAGVLYIFWDITLLQRFINKGLGVFEYLEYKLKKEYERQNG
ncbi:MAG: hypothetical protein ACTTIC_04180 [Helicobacteraceae bacterium]